MKKRLKCILFFEILLMTLVLTSTSSLNAINIKTDGQYSQKNQSIYYDFTDISPTYAWDMLNDPSPENGIQIPIDVRSESEWRDKRIKTPFPEHPRHFSLTDLKTEEGMEEFISLYNNSEIIVYCQSGVRSSNAAYQIDHSDFTGVIYNMIGGISNWVDSGFPVNLNNDIPDQPEKPTGPSIGNAGEEIIFSTKADDPDGDPLKYGWDWDGDETVDELTDYYLPDTSIEISHIWNNGGSYEVKVVAIDNVGDQSEFSEVFTIIINNKPEAPLIEGTLEGKPGEEYTYSFTVTDPDENDLYLYIEWGDDTTNDWSGPYESGEVIDFTKSWNEKDTYIIRAKTKDEYDAESDWTELEVTLAKIRNKKFLLFFQLYNLFDINIFKNL